MELAAGLVTFGTLGNIAAVAQLVGNSCGLISRIIEAARTARQNKVECEHLAGRVSNIGEVLSCLPPDVEVARPLSTLYKTLQEAHDLVVASQHRNIVNQLFRARSRAERFIQVNSRILNDMIVLKLKVQVLSYIASSDRRQNSDQVLPPNHTGVSTSTPTLASAPASSSGSSSLHLQTHNDLPRILTWVEVVTATNNLADEVGKGCSGTVYKGRLFHHGHDRDLEVAVKVLNKQGRLGMEDAFVAELEILYRVRHNHIARLVGWCTDGEWRVFVYEHMSNGTLRDHLLRRRGSSQVATSWRARVEVLLGASRAIEHLHRRAIIHRNVTSSNILLDASWTPRLSDFGTAVLQDHADGGRQRVAEVVGAVCYVDPEYCLTGYVSPASDVYSFGVVMLETLTGRPPISIWEEGEADPGTLMSCALEIIQNGNLRDVLDGGPELNPTTKQLEALKLVADTARRCLQQQGKNRPAMSNVVANLDTAIGIIRKEEPMQC